MSRCRKLKLAVKKKEIRTLTFSNVLTLSHAEKYQFFQFYDEPKRPPLYNKIRKAIYEQGIDYAVMEQKYALTSKRISESLNGKYEKIVLEILLEYYGISPKLTFDDYIANYDFEQKAICHHVGKMTKMDKQKFVIEFEKSWSEDTINNLKKEFQFKIGEQDEWTWEEQLDKEFNERKKNLLLKVSHIYDEYPNLVQEFCDCFVEDNTENI